MHGIIIILLLAVQLTNIMFTYTELSHNWEHLAMKPGLYSIFITLYTEF